MYILGPLDILRTFVRVRRLRHSMVRTGIRIMKNDLSFVRLMVFFWNMLYYSIAFLMVHSSKIFLAWYVGFLLFLIYISFFRSYLLILAFFSLNRLKSPNCKFHFDLPLLADTNHYLFECRSSLTNRNRLWSQLINRSLLISFRLSTAPSCASLSVYFDR